jgi:predicted RNase H-like HicB family nuclease
MANIQEVIELCLEEQLDEDENLPEFVGVQKVTV